MRKLTQSIKDVAVALGQQYTLMLIDEEWCLYRDLGNGYDIEINLSSIRKASINATVKVWQVRDQLKVIQRIEGVSDIETLRRVLRLMINKTNKMAANRNKVYKPIRQAV